MTDFISLKKKIKNLKLELLDEWIDYSIVQDLFGPIEKSFIKLTDDYDKGKQVSLSSPDWNGEEEFLDIEEL